MTTTTPPRPSPADLRASLARDGYVLIPSILPPDQLSALRAAAQRSTALARSGQWPYIRTLPKQFPPWTADASGGIWGVQHLLHPAQPDAGLYASSYFGDAVMGVCAALLGCDSSDDGGVDAWVGRELVMELYNLLVRPDRDFALRWHRDDISDKATPAEELERLAKPAWHAQWNLALYDDASLVVVPGSHARARTEEERSADPFAETLPGMKVVQMRAGDCVFYNNNILHRGVYKADTERMTLHGSVGMVKGNKERARNVLQHGIGEWIGKTDFSGLDEKLRKRAETMRERAVVLGSASGDVGYFSKDE